MAENNDADAVRLRAVLRDSLANERTNPAVAAEREHAPRQWTDAEVAELTTNRYGTEQERLAKLLSEVNRRP